MLGGYVIICNIVTSPNIEMYIMAAARPKQQ